jgi:hypothetical protein
MRLNGIWMLELTWRTIHMPEEPWQIATTELMAIPTTIPFMTFITLHFHTIIAAI